MPLIPMPPYSKRGSLHFRLQPIRPGKLFWPLAQGADDVVSYPMIMVAHPSVPGDKVVKIAGIKSQ